MLRKLLFTLISGLVVLAVTGPAQAAKPTGSTTSSIALNETDPHLGGTVTFTVSHPSTVKNPRVAVRCYQNDAMVYAAAGATGDSFVLGGASSAWVTNGGSAHCTAELFHYVWNGNKPQQYTSLAWTSFDAAG
jgi:hypothetical protein